MSPASSGRRSVMAGLQEGEPLVVCSSTSPADDEYFADGITDEVTARLAAIHGLRVMGSRSAGAYKGKAIAEIVR